MKTGKYGFGVDTEVDGAHYFVWKDNPLNIVERGRLPLKYAEAEAAGEKRMRELEEEKKDESDYVTLEFIQKKDEKNPPSIPPTSAFMRVGGDLMHMMFIGIPPKEKGKVYAFEVTNTGKDFVEFKLVEISGTASHNP